MVHISSVVFVFFVTHYLLIFYAESGTATSQSTPAPSNESPRKHSRKSPLVPRTVTSGPLTVVDLSHIAQARLEDLMMEGDLLEVSLDETQQIWKLLQACNARSQNDRVLEYEVLLILITSTKLKVL